VRGAHDAGTIPGRRPAARDAAPNNNDRTRTLTPDIRQTVRKFIEETFLIGADTRLEDSDSLLQLQVVDSTGFLEIVTFIETEFNVKVADDEMVPENLETIENIDAYVRRKLPA
jgi:acyl carrier protein